MAMPAGGLQRLDREGGLRPDRAVSTDFAASAAKVLPVTVRAEPSTYLPSTRRCAITPMPPALSTSEATYLPLGLMSRIMGVPFADGLEIVYFECDSGFARHGQKVQHGVGGTGRRSNSGDCVVECGAGADVAGTDVLFPRSA